MAGNYVRVGVGVKDEVSGPLDRIKGKFDTLGKSSGFKSLVTGVGLGVGQAAFNLLGDAASGAADFIGESIKASSDLNETLSKSRVIFGASADDIEKFGDSAAKSLGLSKQAAIEAAASMGNFFTGVGQSQQEAAKMSQKLVTLAGDLASFNNLDPSDVLDKLRSGLTGEAEPLRSVGVFLTEAKVKAKAMEMGLGDAHGELTEGEKILARYNIILGETTTAQGDFARTSDGLANSQRTANAELVNAQAQLGESFEPIALGVTEAQIAVVDWFRHGIEGWQMLADAATGGAKEVASSTDKIRGKTVDDLTTVQRAMDDTSDTVRAMGQNFGTVTADSIDYYDALTEAIIDDTNDIIDDAFDPMETKLDAQGDHYEVLAGIVALTEAKNKREHLDAKTSIISSLDDEAQHLNELASKHKLTAKQVDTFESDVTASFKAMGKKVPPEIQKVIAKLRLLASYDGKSVDVTVNIAQRVGISNKSSGAGKHKAAGGPAGGQTVVGEYGPEVVDLPNGSYVHTAQESAKMLGGGGTGNLIQNFNLTVMGDVKADSKESVVAAMRRLKAVGTHYPVPGVLPR